MFCFVHSLNFVSIACPHPSVDTDLYPNTTVDILSTCVATSGLACRAQKQSLCAGRRRGGRRKTPARRGARSKSDLKQRGIAARDGTLSVSGLVPVGRNIPEYSVNT